MGSSLFAAVPAVAMLNSGGRSAAAIEASELCYYNRALDRRTLVVVVSRSGETVEVLKLLPLLRQQDIRVIGVTNVAESTLGRAADILLDVRSDPDKLVAIRTYTGAVAALLSVCAQAMGRNPTEATQLPDLMREVLASESHANTVPEDAHIYLLGRGASLASVHEGALLFHEASRMPAVGMSSAQFRHGPVEAVTPRMVAFVFASQPETKDLDDRLAADLVALGADARVVSPGIAGPWALCPRDRRRTDRRGQVSAAPRVRVRRVSVRAASHHHGSRLPATMKVVAIDIAGPPPRPASSMTAAPSTTSADSKPKNRPITSSTNSNEQSTTYSNSRPTQRASAFP